MAPILSSSFPAETGDSQHAFPAFLRDPAHVRCAVHAPARDALGRHRGGHRPVPWAPHRRSLGRLDRQRRVTVMTRSDRRLIAACIAYVVANAALAAALVTTMGDL